MTTIQPPHLVPALLAEALKANQMERWERAAVDLLVWHETWITRLAYLPEYADAFVIDPVPTTFPTPRCARIRWDVLVDLAKTDTGPPVASSALLVLDAAVSLGGGRPVDVRALAGDSLGTATKRHVLGAITAAFGDVDAHPVWTPDAM